MSVEFLSSILPMLFRGLKLTMLIAVVGILLGFVLGSISGYALQCKNQVASSVTWRQRSPASSLADAQTMCWPMSRTRSMYTFILPMQTGWQTV